jgi:hypothetical protein
MQMASSPANEERSQVEPRKLQRILSSIVPKKSEMSQYRRLFNDRRLGDGQGFGRQSALRQALRNRFGFIARPY